MHAWRHITLALVAAMLSITLMAVACAIGGRSLGGTICVAGRVIDPPQTISMPIVSDGTGALAIAAPSLDGGSDQLPMSPHLDGDMQWIGSIRVQPMINYAGPFFSVVRSERNVVSIRLPDDVTPSASRREELKSAYISAVIQLDAASSNHIVHPQLMAVLRDGHEDTRTRVWLPGILAGLAVVLAWMLTAWLVVRAHRAYHASPRGGRTDGTD